MRSTIFLSLLLAACNDYEIQGGDKPITGADDGTAPDIQLDPTSIAFGQVAVGSGLATIETVTVSNLGDDALEIRDMWLENPDYGAVYTVSAIGSVLVPPGGSTAFTVTYEPLTAIEYSTRVLIDSNDPDEPQVGVELLAEGLAPMIELSPTSYDFGTMYIGCEAVHPVTITNRGNTDLIVSDLNYYSASVELDFDPNLAVNGELPWTIEANDSREVYVTYGPLDDYADTGYLSVLSNDTYQADAHAYQAGAGDTYGENLDLFDQPIRGASDILFVIDNSSSMGNEQASLASNFEYFAAGLVELEVDYQLAVITVDDPEFQGTARGTPIITEDTDDVIGEFIAQTNVGLVSGVTESPSEMAYQATSAGGDAGPGSDFLRDDARLAMIFVSDEPDYSPSDWEFYLAHFQSLKSDPDDVVAHAISGDYPGGCGDASATDKVYDLTVATGGLYLSVCATDWASHLELLVEASSADLTSFELTEEPVPETIEVRIDGITTTTGWTYDPAGRSVDFDESHVPEGGSTIEVEYTLLGDCEG